MSMVIVFEYSDDLMDDDPEGLDKALDGLRQAVMPKPDRIYAAIDGDAAAVLRVFAHLSRT
jgi:hypothetical protein